MSTLLLVSFIAVLAPLLMELPWRVRLPVVVIEVAFGIAVGPHGLGLAGPDQTLALLARFGMAFLFFLAGMELDFHRMGGVVLRQAGFAWAASLVLGLALGLILAALGFIKTPLLVAIAMTSTALGTLVPALRDSGELESRFGTFVIAGGAMGELGPIVATAMLLSQHASAAMEMTLLLVFAFIALLASVIALRARSRHVMRLLDRTMEASSQLPVRLCLLVLVCLVALAGQFGFDIVLGAFAAGMIVGLGGHGEGGRKLHAKLDAIGFGLLVPVFFIVSGMSFNVSALLESTESLLRVPVFLGALLLVRGVPSWYFNRKAGLSRREALRLGLMMSATFPLVVAITEIGRDTGQMREENAAALVGAGMLSVFLFPLLALLLRRGGRVHARTHEQQGET